MKILSIGNKKAAKGLVNCPHCDSLLEVEPSDFWLATPLDHEENAECAHCHKLISPSYVRWIKQA